ncbi:MAG TPA: DUF6689 family protein [Thermoanaerobaculia bacterium]|nr:DUF6689 family protein [Thermoanaerobaculia bacterium]
MKRILAFLALVAFSALPAAGQGVLSADVDGDSISIRISVLGLGADLNLAFEEVTGLSLANLGVSAQLVNPFSPSLRARLPSGSGVIAVPLLIRIEPPASGSLSFTGVATIDFHTNLVHYLPGTPLRLFSAPAGGPFEDITMAMGSGSYRARANKGGFSEFLIVADLRPVNQVIGTKFNRLEQLLDQYEDDMPGSVYDDLEESLEDARAAFDGGSTSGAIEEINEFLDLVEQHSGTEIPDVWRAARDVTNVAGYLRGAATTLRFSLKLKSGSGLF